MGLHNGLPTHLLLAGLLLLLVSPGSTLSTRQEARQLRGAPSGRSSEQQGSQKNKAAEDADDDAGDESDSEDDEQSDEDKAREDKEAKLKRNVKEAKAELEQNLDEQAEMSSRMQFVEDVGDGNVNINANVKAVARETESAEMASYLGDMWKEMRMFSGPFYQEHLMEQRMHADRREEGLRMRYKAEQLKLKRQKLTWKREDAEEDAGDEKDPKKKAEDRKKVAKLEEEEKQAEKDETKVEKQAKKQEAEEAFDILGPLPWMKDKKQRQEARAKKPREAPAAKAKESPEDNTVKPDWMKALEDASGAGNTAPAKEEDAPKETTKDADGDDEETTKRPVESEETTKDADDDDDEDSGKWPWMKNRKKRKPAKVEKKPVEPEEDNTVKPPWMKALESNEETVDDKSPGTQKGKAQGRKGKASPPVPHGKHKPMFTSKTMPGVSPAVECVVILTWTFFIVYTALAVLRSANQLTQSRFASCMRVQDIIAMVCPYVMFAPMLSVLFLATRMRAIQLAQGDTERYELPQPWVQFSMYTATYGVMSQAVFKLVVFATTYRTDVVHGGLVNGIFAAAKYIFMACIYGGFTAVCIGAIFMPAPKGLWGDDAPPVSATLSCTLMLTTTFFAIYLGLSLFRTAEELKPSLTEEATASDNFVKVQLLFWRARHAVNLAPMLCVLFIVVRMRALQMDPNNGNPPSWAQIGMYISASALVVQVAASIILPLMDKRAYILPGPVQGQIILVMSNPRLKILGGVIRYVPLLCMYGGASAVVTSIFVMDAPKGKATPDISATTSCIVSLTTLYFVVFTAVYVAQTVMECLRESRRAKRVVTVLDAGQKTVMFAPMLCVVFIAARMRALQLTRTVDGNIPAGAGPQTWVQEGMYVATWAIVIQVLLAFITTAILGSGYASSVEDTASVKDDQHAPRNTADDTQQATNSADKRSVSPNMAVAGALDVFKYLCLIAMYGGAVTVMVGIVVMTPETLPPYYEGRGVIQGIMKACLLALQ